MAARRRGHRGWGADPVGANSRRDCGKSRLARRRRARQCAQRHAGRHRPGGTRRAVRRARAAGLHARRPDRARPGDRATTSSTRPPSCRPAGPTCRTAAPTGSRAATTTRCSATPSGPNSWKSFLFPADAAGLDAPAATRDGGARRDGGRRRRRRATPSSACAPATCTRSRSRTASSSSGRYVDPRLRGAAARAPSSSPSTAARPAATCFCVSMDTGPQGDAPASTSRSPSCSTDGGHRFLVEVGSERGAEVLAELPRAAPPRRTSCRRPSERSSAPPPRWAARSTPPASRTCSYAQPRAPALGRRRRPLPDLRQLHDGLPDLLLHAPSRTSTDLAGEEAERTRAVGLVLHARPLLHPRRQRARARPQSRYRQWMTHKLATWIDQFGTLGLRRLRALHHLVPGGDRHHRGGRRDPRDRPAGGRSMQTVERAARRGAGAARRSPPEHRATIAGCARNARLRAPASTCCARASRPNAFFVDPPRHRRARDLRAPARRA